MSYTLLSFLFYMCCLYDHYSSSFCFVAAPPTFLFFLPEQTFLWSLQFHLAKPKNTNYLFPAAPQTKLYAKLLWVAEPVAQSRWDWWSSMPPGPAGTKTEQVFPTDSPPAKFSARVHTARHREQHRHSTVLTQMQTALMASSVSPLWLMRLADC